MSSLVLINTWGTLPHLFVINALVIAIIALEVLVHALVAILECIYWIVAVLISAHLTARMLRLVIRVINANRLARHAQELRKLVLVAYQAIHYQVLPVCLLVLQVISALTAFAQLANLLVQPARHQQPSA